MVCSYLSHQWRHSRRHWEILDEPPSICHTYDCQLTDWIHCESYNLQAGLKNPLTRAKRRVGGNTSSSSSKCAKRPGGGRNFLQAKSPGGGNILVAKRLGGKTSRWRNVQGPKRPGAKCQRGETSINRVIISRPWKLGDLGLHDVRLAISTAHWTNTW